MITKMRAMVVILCAGQAIAVPLLRAQEVAQSDREAMYYAVAAGSGPTQRVLARSLREAERVHIQLVLEEVAWNKKQAAKILEISRGTLYRKIAEYHMQPSQTEPTATAQPSER